MLVAVDVFEAVADRHRRGLLDLLVEGERSVSELVNGMAPLSQPAVSQHLKVLRDLGLVEVRPVAQRRLYALGPSGLDEIDTWLERYRRYAAEHLDALERHLDRTAAAKRAEQGTKTKQARKKGRSK